MERRGMTFFGSLVILKLAVLTMMIPPPCKVTVSRKALKQAVKRRKRSVSGREGRAGAEDRGTKQHRREDGCWKKKKLGLGGKRLKTNE